MNHQEVVEEDRKSKLPANWEKRQERMKLEEELEKKKQVSSHLTAVYLKRFCCN
jgi:pre-mRNA-splicing factor SYF2